VRHRSTQIAFGGEGDKILLAVERRDDSRLIGEVSLIWRSVADQQAEVQHHHHRIVAGPGLDRRAGLVARRRSARAGPEPAAVMGTRPGAPRSETTTGPACPQNAFLVTPRTADTTPAGTDASAGAFRRSRRTGQRQGQRTAVVDPADQGARAGPSGLVVGG